MKAEVSIYDIARKAGVSHVTVSNVLNRRGYEHKVSRGRFLEIQKLARDMGYVPNRVARRLRSGKTHMIMILTKSALYHPDVNEMIEKVHEAFLPHGYQILIELLPQTSTVENGLPNFARGNVDGGLVLGYETRWLESFVKQCPAGMPMVLISPMNHLRVPSVTYDRVCAAELAVGHLMDLGHRNVVMVYDAVVDLASRQRVQGYRAALEKRNLPFREDLLVRSAVEVEFRALWAQIAALKPKPTALFCYNDELLLGLLQAIHRDGLRVPEDVALAVMGNTRLTRMGDVPLTAVDMNNERVAKVAVEMLLSQIEGKRVPVRHVLIEPSLVPRASSLGSQA